MSRPRLAMKYAGKTRQKRWLCIYDPTPDKSLQGGQFTTTDLAYMRKDKCARGAKFRNQFGEEMAI